MENKQDGFCSDDSVRDKDYVPDHEAETDCSDQGQSEDDSDNWIFAGLGKAEEKDGKRRQCEEDAAAGNNELQDGNEELMGEKVESTAIEGRVTSNSVEMSTSGLDIPKKSKKRKLKQ